MSDQRPAINIDDDDDDDDERFDPARTHSRKVIIMLS